MTMMCRLWVFLFLTATVAVMLSTSQEATGETDPFVDKILYSSSSVEDTVVLQSGRDNATYYRYLIIDDYEDSPENWSQPGFNDSEWEIGAAPCGDRNDNGVDYGTEWDTDGDNNDVILIRHKFNMPNGVIVSAELNVAEENEEPFVSACHRILLLVYSTQPRYYATGRSSEIDIYQP